jgi:hypothetical protein
LERDTSRGAVLDYHHDAGTGRVVDLEVEISRIR